MKSRRRSPRVRSLCAFATEQLETRLLFTIPGTQLDIWHTYTQATADLQTIHNAYPTITNLISIGKTVQNRDIWAMEVTDNPGVQEDEPEFYYQGGIHGDEPIGMENSFHLIQYLLENYNQTSTDGVRATKLVNGMDMWFVPDLNWDGYTLSSPSSGHRGNANNVDLNRNFPEWTSRSFSSDTKYFGHYGNEYDGPAPTNTLLQPETKAMMSFLTAHSFVASANFHSGDLVVNYPWDTDGSVGANYATSPDDSLFRQMALTYSLQNGPMAANTSQGFDRGTTNGDNWYPISGGEQDWANLYTGDFQFTIELDNVVKYPAASQLPTFWSQNRESMLQYMEAANWGVRGVMTNSSGQPVFGKITVVAPAPSPTPDPNHPALDYTFSDPDVGDYHRMLLPGTYTLKFEAAGYQTQTISNIVVGSRTNDPSQTLRLDVTMQAVDSTPPTVSSWALNSLSANTQSLSIQFSENVQASLSNADLDLHTPSFSVPAANIVLSNYDTGNNTATFTFTGYPDSRIPTGAYTANFFTGSVTDASGNALNIASSGRHFIYVHGLNTDDSIRMQLTSDHTTLQVWQNTTTFTLGNSNSLPISGTDAVIVDGLGGNDTLTLDFTNGDVRPTVPGSSFSYRLGTSNETLALTGTTNWLFNTDPGADANQPNLTLNLSNGAAVTFGSSQVHLDGLVIGNGGVATVAQSGAIVLLPKTLTITGTGMLDLKDNDLLSSNTPKATIEGYITTAYNFGDWLGAGGIFSTTARDKAVPNTTLGVMSGQEFNDNNGGLFNSIAPNANDVLVKYTYFGDVDFNGQVDVSDYNLIDFGFANHLTGWANGDADYSGAVDASDYNVIDFAFATQSGVL